MNVITMSTTKPVSYTHLDVYKRQLPLLVFDRVTSAPDLRHFLFQLADRCDRVFVVPGQTMISDHVQKLGFRQISQETLTYGRAV